jgi:hypothetical protein
MRIIYALLIVFLAMFPASTFAQLYRYTDQNGVRHFTDNLADVPENQQLKVQSYSEGVKNSKSDDRTQKAVKHHKRQGSPAAKDKRNQITIDEDHDLTLPERLRRVKAELDKEHSEIMKQRQGLSKGREMLTTQTESKGYKEKEVQFNKHIVDFDKRQKLYQEKVEAYNKEVNQ